MTTGARSSSYSPPSWEQDADRVERHRGDSGRHLDAGRGPGQRLRPGRRRPHGDVASRRRPTDRRPRMRTPRRPTPPPPGTAGPTFSYVIADGKAAQPERTCRSRSRRPDREPRAEARLETDTGGSAGRHVPRSRRRRPLRGLRGAALRLDGRRTVHARRQAELGEGDPGRPVRRGRLGPGQDTPGSAFKVRVHEYSAGVSAGSVSTTVTLTSAWQARLGHLRPDGARFHPRSAGIHVELARWGLLPGRRCLDHPLTHAAPFRPGGAGRHRGDAHRV